MKKWMNLWATVAGVVFLAALVSLDGHAQEQGKDDLFAAGPSAARFVSFDGSGFVVHGQRTFLTSGSVHYPRVPRESWNEVLLKMKRAGFNTVQTYVFWNYHEATEGKYDFATESRDLGAFLDAAKAQGLYAIVRVGPYACAEWENGGFPNWLAFKPGLEVRRNNPAFLAAVDTWFNRMLPIVAERQIQRGGNVIMVQVENEQPQDHWAYWGTHMDGAYDEHLMQLMHDNGIEVPMFLSGLNHGHDPAPASPVQHSTRKSPWMTTELWTTWFDRYGVDARDLRESDRHIWRVLAEGGNGLNLYMAHGGTTFGSFGFNENRKPGDHHEVGGTTYDYGTLIGQTGNITELYTRFKRLGYLANSFSSILADGDDATARFASFAQGVKVTAHSSKAGTLVFLDNPGEATVARLRSGASLAMRVGEIVALPVDLPLAEGVALREADSRVLGLLRNPGLTTLVLYGPAGSSGQILLSGEGHPRILYGTEDGFNMEHGKDLAVRFGFAKNHVSVAEVQFDHARLRLLAMDESQADKSWIVDDAQNPALVVGPSYLAQFELNGQAHGKLGIDEPLVAQASVLVTIYRGSLVRSVSAGTSSRPVKQELALSAWQQAAAVPAGQWMHNADGTPPLMAQDGDNSPYAWYRVEFTAEQPDISLCFAHIGDRAVFFVDGKQAAQFDFMKDARPCVKMQVKIGKHKLEAFVAHDGRSKFSGYTGALNKLEYQKGLSGPALLDKELQPITGWEMQGGADPAAPTLIWKQADAAPHGPTFWRSTFRLHAAPEAGIVYRFDAAGLSFGSVWVNGHNIGRYPEIVKGCNGLWIPSVWMRQGDNQIEILDEQGISPARSRIVLEPGASRHHFESNF